MRKILILFFHPLFHKSRVNKILLHAAEQVEGLTLRIMYDLYPDFHIDMKAEQEVLLEHDVIVWQHPMYWYSSPSLLKEWIDIVLEHGFAYGRGGKALAGKMLMSALTVGGSRQVYGPEGARKYTVPQLLVPYKLTCSLCQMDYLPPFVVHGTHLMDDEEMAKAAGEYQKALEQLRNGGLDARQLEGCTYMNDYFTQP
jgi:glutathione-regulated potassium-efflux system ancillary protein KefG